MMKWQIQDINVSRMKYKFCGNKLSSEVSFSLSCTSIQFQDKIESSLRVKHLKATDIFTDIWIALLFYLQKWAYIVRFILYVWSLPSSFIDILITKSDLL